MPGINIEDPGVSHAPLIGEIGGMDIDPVAPAQDFHSGIEPVIGYEWQIELSLKRHARHNRQLFEARPMKAYVRRERRKLELEAVRQLGERVKNRQQQLPPVLHHDNDSELCLQDYQHSIRIASLLADSCA